METATIRILAGGHSHVYCMLEALNQGRRPAGRRAAVAYSADLSQGPPGDESYWDLLVAAGAELTVALVWNGNQHNAAFLIEPEPAFRIFNSAAEAQAPDGVWVARETVREYWAPTFSELAHVLRRLVSVAAVVVLGTPPPKSDPAVRQSLEREPVFTKRAKELSVDVTNLRVTSEVVRLAMWQVIQDALGQAAVEAGAIFFRCPRARWDRMALWRTSFRRRTLHMPMRTMAS